MTPPAHSSRPDQWEQRWTPPHSAAKRAHARAAGLGLVRRLQIDWEWRAEGGLPAALLARRQWPAEV